MLSISTFSTQNVITVMMQYISKKNLWWNDNLSFGGVVEPYFVLKRRNILILFSFKMEGWRDNSSERWGVGVTT